MDDEPADEPPREEQPPDELPRLWAAEPTPAWGHPGVEVSTKPPPELGTAGTVLRTARAYAGLSQRELAERTGLAQSMIARIESARSTAHWSVLSRCVHTCGLRFALVAEDGEVIDHSPLVTARDAAGRHYPAHLPVRRVMVWWQWWRNGGRYAVDLRIPVPPYTFPYRSHRRRWQEVERRRRPERGT